MPIKVSRQGVALPYRRLVAFGDSLSDAGNVFHLTSAEPVRYHPDPAACARLATVRRLLPRSGLQRP